MYSLPQSYNQTSKCKRCISSNAYDFTSIYGHLYSVLVNAKQAVEAGQPIGISGSTGRSTGEHLHFQMEYKDKTIDPKPILDYINEVIRTVKGQISQQIDNELRRK